MLLLFSVNSAFDVLRTMIPIDPPDRKLSKIETLQLATKYINHLSQILNSGNVSLESRCRINAQMIHNIILHNIFKQCISLKRGNTKCRMTLDRNRIFFQDDLRIVDTRFTDFASIENHHCCHHETT